MTIAPLTILDTFSRTANDTWGTSDTGQAWTGTGTNYDVAGGSGIIHCAANAPTIQTYINLASYNIPLQTTAEVLMRVKYTGSAAWPLTDFGPLLAWNNSNKTGYYLTLQGNYGNAAIGVFINGYRYELVRKSGVYLDKDTWFWVRFKRTSNAVMGKIWQEGIAEPSAWTISGPYWNASNAPTTGSGGLFRVGTRDTYDVHVETWYFYTNEDTEGTGDVIDDFSRTVTDGFGISTSNHAWQGSFSDDPEYTASIKKGSVSGGLGSLALTNTVGSVGWLGPVRSGDVEGYTEFTIGSGASGAASATLTLRGTKGKFVNSPSTLTGYRLTYASTGAASSLSLDRRDAYITDAALGSASITHIPDGTKVAMRFQIVGTTVRGRAWNASLGEPSTWDISVTDATITSGRLGLSIQQTTSVARTVTVDRIQQTAPSISNVNAVTTGGISTATSATATTITASYTGDANDNSTATIRYKPTTATAWSAPISPTSTNRGTKTFTFNITGLIPATSYHAEITYQDADGVQGANPILYVVTTTSTAIRTKGLSITGSTSSSVSIEATYELDSDSDSTATVEARTISTTLAQIEDYFVDERDGTYLQNAESVHGGAYVKHPSMTAAVHAIRKNMHYYSNALLPTDLLLYRHTEQTPSAEYDLEATFLANQLQGRTGLAARLDDTANTYYGAGIDSSTNQWELFKMVSGTKTLLATSTFGGETGVIYKLNFIVRDAYKSVLLNGTEIMRTTDNSISAIGYSGYYSTNIAMGNSTNQFLLGSFITTYHASAGSWVSFGSMTPDRPNKKFTHTLTPLLEDILYEIRVTFADADGQAGSNPLMITTQIVGESSSLTLMGVSTNDTSAVLSIFYTGDSNDNSYVEFQYRSTMSTLWNTLSFNKFRTDRDIKRFDVTINGLAPNTTYAVKATLVDPDGISVSGVGSLSAMFSTRGVSLEETKQTKHYLWKVYNRFDKYLGTIQDAPEPEFSILENGGVTDLDFKLTRKMNEIQAHKIIDYQNRIDIWAIDPSSNGMGPNMMDDPDCDESVGAWLVGGDVFGQNAIYDASGGPDGGSAIRITQADTTQYETSSSPIEVSGGLPLVISCIAKARGAKLRMYVRAYDINDVALSTSDFAETVGVDWQTISVEYIPPATTSYVRVLLRNTGKGTMWADKFNVMAKEMLVYRGRIESFTPRIDEDGEEVSIEALGLTSLLSDDYIEFLQFVEVQPQKDIEANRINFGAKDPADMVKKIIDEAKRVNPLFTLYYTTESIRYTGNLMQYTFRDQQIRSCLDKVRTLCPSGWHYFIEADGLFVLRGPEHAPTHTLHIGREIQTFEVEKSIRDLKNYVRVKGRQDEDVSETDGYGSINYIAFDQESIDKYGKRTLFIRDSQLTDPDSAKIVGDGRLDENNREQQRATCLVPDEKGFYVQSGPLRGYNIESFRAGDNVVIVDPIAGARNTYWNQFNWDEEPWDSSNVFMPLPESVPIKKISYRGDHVQLELSERPPSGVGNASKLFRWIANKDRED